MVNSLIKWTGFVIMIAYLCKHLMDAGMFRQIETKGLDQCRLVVPSDGNDQAFEDMAVDYDRGIAYVVGDNRSWWHSFTAIHEIENKHGSIYVFDIQKEKFQKLNLIDYPYEHFHPLGMNLLKGKKQRLLATNFRTENRQILGTVEIFEIDLENQNQIHWKESIVSPLFTVPDDVYAVDENTFYVTNVYRYRKDQSVAMHLFETVTARYWTNILLCKKTNQWQCSIIDDSMGMANGIAASLDLKTLYVAASLEKRVRVYERHPENNSLTYQTSLYVPFLLDNVLVDESNQLIVAGHPKALDFLLHVKNHVKNRAPTEVVVFRSPKSNSTFDRLLLTNGEKLSGSTVGAIYKQKLLVGALCDPGILVCDNLV